MHRDFSECARPEVRTGRVHDVLDNQSILLVELGGALTTLRERLTPILGCEQDDCFVEGNVPEAASDAPLVERIIGHNRDVQALTEGIQGLLNRLEV